MGKARAPGLKPEEKAVLDHLVAAWEGFRALGEHHPADLADFATHLHAIQNLMAFRVARRVDPDEWWQPEEATP